MKAWEIYSRRMMGRKNCGGIDSERGIREIGAEGGVSEKVVKIENESKEI